MRQRAGRVLGVLACGALALAGVALDRTFSEEPPSLDVPAAASQSRALDPEPDPGSAACERALRLPTGRPAMLDCDEARAIVRQVRARLASTPSEPAPPAFASAVSGWLDPHGLWSAAPDAPPRARIRVHAERMLDELESDQGDCEAARDVGRTTRDWVRELGTLYARARVRARSVPVERARELARGAVYQDDPVTRPGRALAADLGDRAGRFQLAFGQDVGFSVAALENRLFPELGVEDWTRVVLAAAVRAYVPLADPHGQWAPIDEEWSLYTGDSAFDPGPALWERMTRTALGVRVLEGAAAPLARDDLVLSVGGIATAGLSVEQLEQLARLESIGGETLRDVVVLRASERAPRTLRVEIPEIVEADRGGALVVERVPYGEGHVAVIAIADVTDSLGEELMDVVARMRRDREHPLGILLDLRGNGGGSTDGAGAAIGVFLPGVPSFPMRRRVGAVEIEHASSPPLDARWAGPVASLVDGHTASAAEMIAGAIASYGRGTVIGSRTFGKGCVQEYFDDRAGAGVLRLTTMVFALPDGSPLQGVGLEPGLELELPRVRERESLLGSAPPWRGPDVRDRTRMGGARWSAHLNRVGPCADPAVCAALRRLGATTARRTASSRSVVRRVER